MENNQPEQQFQIKAGDEILKGVYSNMVSVAHNAEEFILDFMNLLPPTGTLNARVIVSPGHFKRIIAALQDNLKRYESQFGEIKLPQGLGQPPTTSSTSDNKYGFDTDKAE
jgi:hypothetical protein